MAVAEEDVAARVARAISWDGEAGSWDDVVARSARHRHRAPRIGRTALIAAALVLLGGSLALAVGTRVVHELTGSPAPPAIRKELGALPKQFAGGRIVVSSARQLITLRTHRFGVARLYTARTDTGGRCDLVTNGTTHRMGCNPALSPATPMMFGFTGTRDVPGSNLVDGRVRSTQGRSLRIRFRHGSTRTMPLVEAHFLFELGPGHSRRSADPPIAFDVLDGSSRRIASWRDPLGAARLPSPKAPASG
jgi:hypothetical protein